MLNFNPSWRFSPPPDGRFRTTTIPEVAKDAFYSLILKISAGSRRQEILELFKEHYTRTMGQSYMWSSSESWTESDLDYAMTSASVNAPLFLLALFTSFEDLNKQMIPIPDIAYLNNICMEHSIGYVFEPPNLVLRETSVTTPVPVQNQSSSLASIAMDTVHQSLQRSQELMQSGRYREAVQECLWVLESLTTAFRGIETNGEIIKGKYFNEIIADLRRKSLNPTLNRVIEWVTGLHGYLSSPTGGGIRHGADLLAITNMNRNDATLFCNLIRSYISFLLTEHEYLMSEHV
jgi:hypothetical protein